MQGARRRPWLIHGQAAQRRRRPLQSQPFGTGRICLHSSLSPPYWVRPNRVGSASTEGKSVLGKATGNTQTGSSAMTPKAAHLEDGVAKPAAWVGHRERGSI